MENNIVQHDTHIANNGAVFNIAHASQTLKLISSTIESTFGPAGANTLFIRGTETDGVFDSAISKDGFTVLSKMILTEPVPACIRNIIIQAMQKILETAGDGTSTTTILIDRLFRRIIKNPHISSLPPQVKVNVMASALETIKNWSLAINKINNELTVDELKNIVRTSLNGDVELEDAVVKATDELLALGVDISSISIRSSRDLSKDKASFEIIDGYTIPAGMHETRIFDNITLEKVNVAIINESIATSEAIEGIGKLIQSAGETGLPLLLITYGIKSPQSLSYMLHRVYNQFAENHDRHVPQVFLLQYYKGGSIVDVDTHDDFQAWLGQTTLYELGSTTHDIFGKEFAGENEPVEEYLFNLLLANELPTVTMKTSKSSVILSDIKCPNTVNTILESRFREIEDTIENGSPDKRELAEIRKSRLTGKYAQLTIGGENEWDVARKADAIEDAVGAIRLAVKSKAVAGMSTYIPKIIHMYDDELNNMSSIEASVIKDISDAYIDVISTLCHSATLDDNDINASIKNIMDACTEVSEDIEGNEKKILELIKISFNLKDKIAKYQDGNSLTQYATNTILNSTGAEVKILEASCKAVSTLLSINQALLPDVFDANNYRRLK